MVKRHRKINDRRPTTKRDDYDNIQWRIQWKMHAKSKVRTNFRVVFIFAACVFDDARKESVTNKLIISFILTHTFHSTRALAEGCRCFVSVLILADVSVYSMYIIRRDDVHLFYMYVCDRGLINKFYVCIRVS